MSRINKKTYLMIVVLAAGLIAATGYYMTTNAAQRSDQNRQGRIIRGRVISTYGPVENARVRVAGEDRYARTDKRWRSKPCFSISRAS